MADKIDQSNLAGTVILYDSPVETMDNIMTYLHQVEKLYVVDNSANQNQELIRAFQSSPKIQYYAFGENKGIATALNWAARQAIADGFSILLTMDDDTRTPERMVEQMIEFWNKHPEPIGILSGVHHNRPATVPYRLIPYTLTSGNIVNLKAYEEIGGFRDDFFIDHVDHDFGIRLNKRGYPVIELPGLRLDHLLGYSQHIKIGDWSVRKYGTSSPIRLYYYGRNGIYLSRMHGREYPNFVWEVTKEMIRRWIKALVLDKDRMIRIRMLVAGMRDGWYSHLGDYSNRKST